MKFWLNSSRLFMRESWSLRSAAFITWSRRWVRRAFSDVTNARMLSSSVMEFAGVGPAGAAVACPFDGAGVAVGSEMRGRYGGAEAFGGVEAPFGLAPKRESGPLRAPGGTYASGPRTTAPYLSMQSVSGWAGSETAL